MSQPPVHRHGLTQYFIENEGTVAPAATPSPRLPLLVPDVEKALEAEQPQEDAERALDPAEIELRRSPTLELAILSCV